MRMRLLIASLLVAGAAAAQPVVSVPPSGDLRATLYEGGQAVFAEHRRATVAAGASELQLTGLPSGLLDVPADLQVLQGPALRVLDQRVMPAAERPGKGLAALVGETIRLVRHGPGGEQTAEGKLLRVAPSGAVAALQVGDRVVLDPEGEVQVTPEQLAVLTRPTMLSCHVQSEAAGEVELLVTYLLSPAVWEMQHALVLSEDAATASLTSWAMARLPGAAGMTANLRFVAGSAAEADRAPEYVAARPATFGPDGATRLVLIEAPEVPITNLLLFDGGTLERLAGEKPVAGPVARVTRFEVSRESGVGTYLPAGKVVVYQRAPQGGVRLVSQAAMPAAGKGATLDLVLGEAAGLRATAKQASWRQLSPEDIERKCEIVIAKPTGAAETVTCGVTMAGAWRIAEASHPSQVRPGNRVEFSVPMAADKTSATLLFTVRVHAPPASGEAKGGETAPPVPGPSGAKE